MIKENINKKVLEMIIKGSDKKKAIVELSAQQDNTVIRLAKRRKLYKVDVIRKLIDVLEGLDGDIHIVAYDKSNVSVLSNFGDVMNVRREENITDFTLQCDYSRNSGVTAELNFNTAVSFGGDINGKED